MGAPSTGAKSLECCGRAGGHQEQQQLEEGREHQVAARQLQHFQDQENNNFPNNIQENILIHNFNNNHIYVNPNEYSYFTVIDERENQINNNTRRSTAATLTTLQTLGDREETSFIRRSKNQKRKFFKRDKEKEQDKDKEKKKKPTNPQKKEKDKEKKKQSSNAVPPAARLRSQGRGMDDPLTQRPRRKLTAKQKDAPPEK